MGFLDKAKAAASKAVTDHGDKIDQGLDKLGDVANAKTGGKHGDKIAQGKTKAREALSGLDDKRTDPTT